jgi:hypothetical protein
MKIGIIKPTELNNGFSGDFWRMGTFILPYDETIPTDFGRELDINVQFYLYKDFDAYINNLYSMDTIWINTSLSYTELNTNAFDNILSKVVAIEDGYFVGCELKEV